MKYIVTGGAGFIGSHMAEHLIQAGHDVHVVDNLLTGKHANLAFLETVGQFTFHELDVADHQAMEGICQGADTLFHFAALPSVPLSVEDPLTTNHHGVDGTLGALIAAKNAGVRRVIYSASSAAYGNVTAQHITEASLPAPISPYGVAKLVGEYYCKAFYASYGLEAISLRYFNIFGSRQDPNSAYAAVIPKFITTMLKGERPTIFGDGSQTRDFTHVANIVHANWLASQTTHPEAFGKVMNVATGTSISVLEMLQALNNVLGTHLDPIHAPVRAGDILHSGSDITLARNLLGFAPIVDFQEGIDRTITWYRQQV